MSKAISYSIFGYGKERNENCFDFSSYMRGLGICLRANRILYPDWVSIIHTDSETYGAFYEYFNALNESTNIEVQICDDAPLCKAMLWRMKPCFDQRFTHVICRDVDSPATYREVQAVQYWISKETKAAHAITDSDSHTLALMGGMIGFMPKHFSGRTGFQNWDEMISKSQHQFDYKGSDQCFLNDIIYPNFGHKGTDSITQHYFKGYGESFLSDWHHCDCPPPSGHASDCPNNFPIDLPEELKESNSMCGHIGAAGHYEPPTFKFLRRHWDKFTDILEAERLHPEIFYWTKE